MIVGRVYTEQDLPGLREVERLRTECNRLAAERDVLGRANEERQATIDRLRHELHKARADKDRIAAELHIVERQIRELVSKP